MTLDVNLDISQGDMMDAPLAIQICEQLVMAEHDEEVEAWQYLIDTGLVWQLQGSYGRTAQRLIEEGVCNAPEWAND